MFALVVSIALLLIRFAIKICGQGIWRRQSVTHMDPKLVTEFGNTPLLMGLSAFTKIILYAHWSKHVKAYCQIWRRQSVTPMDPDLVTKFGSAPLHMGLSAFT